jgi:hypothetical protein
VLVFRVNVEVDHREFTYYNKGTNRENLNWHEVMDAMISCMKAMGLEPDMESLLDYFGIEVRLAEDVDEDGGEI